MTTGMVMIEGRSVGEVRKLQEEDPTIGPILSALLRDDKPSPDYAKGQSPEFRKLVQIMGPALPQGWIAVETLRSSTNCCTPSPAGSINSGEERHPG